jgi:phospholipase C
MKRSFRTFIVWIIGLGITAASASGQALPQFGHVVLVVGENHSFTQTYTAKPKSFLTSLANTYGLGINDYADTHPSLGNYLNLATGQILTNDDSQTPSTFPVPANNIALAVQQAGKTWKDYVENLPTVSGCGGLNAGKYYVRHDPLQYMTTINNETGNFVCFSQFASDLSNHSLPSFSWLVPNGCDDAHDCKLKVFDNWLKTEIGPLLQSSYFQAGGDGLLIIVFDENNFSGLPNCSTLTTGQGCGGRVELVVVSPFSKLGYQSPGGDLANFNDSYEEENILRTIAEGLGLSTSDLGAASTAVPMADFF